MVPNLAPWREAVRRATAAIGIIELPSTRFLELSAAAVKLVGPTTTTGLDLLASNQRAQAAAITAATAAGTIDGSESRRRQWHRPDGSIVDVIVRGRAIRVTGGSFGLFFARDVSRLAPDDTWDLDDIAERAGNEGSFDLRAVVTLDDRWKVQTVSGDIDAQSVLREGTTLTALTDPGDMARLLFAFAGATTHADSATAIHLSSGSRRYAVDVDVAMLQHGSWNLTLAPAHGREGASTPRTSELEQHLRRIAAEVEASGILERTRTVAYASRFPQVGSLSTRQSEVLSRLLNGERVPTIAKGLFVSQSTVRNHLSAIFERFGVHSQAELLAVLSGVEETSG